MAQQTGFTLWFTGMAGSGKSTLAKYLAERLDVVGRVAEVLDENLLGEFLSPAAQPTKEERIALTRKIGWGAALLSRQGTVALVACESPIRDGRDSVRREIPRFIEVFCDCPTDKLIERDKTGLYKKALTGQIPHFTGVTDPYETPQAAEAVVHTDVETVEQSATQVLQAMVNVGYLKPEEVEKMLGTKLRKKRHEPVMVAPIPLYKPSKDAKAPKGKPEKIAKAVAPPKAVKPTKPPKKDVAPKKTVALKKAVKPTKPLKKAVAPTKSVKPTKPPKKAAPPVKSMKPKEAPKKAAAKPSKATRPSGTAKSAKTNKGAPVPKTRSGKTTSLSAKTRPAKKR